MRKYDIISTANDSEDNFRYYYSMLCNRIVNIFKFENLPETVDEHYLNYMLFTLGHTTFFKYNDDVVIDFCALGGEPSGDYMPTLAVMANPVYGSKNLKVNSDCAVVFTSTADMMNARAFPWGGFFGVCPTEKLIHKTAELLANSLTSLNIAIKNTRATFLVTVPTASIKDGVEKTLERMYRGEPYTVAIDNGYNENITAVSPLMNSSVGNSTLQELRETQQYLLSQFYHAIGIDSNANYKRERLTVAEINADGEPLLINVLDMIKTVKDGIAKVNEIFGTEISVKLNDEWKEEVKQLDTDIEETELETDTESEVNENEEV